MLLGADNAIVDRPAQQVQLRFDAPIACLKRSVDYSFHECLFDSARCKYLYLMGITILRNPSSKPQDGFRTADGA
jgi:hypothetical protein